MKITYLGHSGFLVETEKQYLLFDYYTGKLPVFSPEKRLTVLVSHSHQDHYNKVIYALQEQYRSGSAYITYVLDKGIRIKQARESIQEPNELLVVKAHERYELYDGELVIETLKSTDEGVAYIVEGKEFRLFHSGDLNLWVWEGESKAYNNNMKANFYREMELLRGQKFDAAFVPLDPRLEGNAFGGMDGFLEAAEAKKVFPMHFWKQPEIIRAYQKARPDRKNIVMLEREGESFYL